MSKTNIRLILELLQSGLSQRSIAATRRLSRNTIREVHRIAQDKQITTEKIKDLSDSELYFLFFPQKYVANQVYEMPDYDQVHLELKRVGVTLKLLWLEYQARVLKNNQILSTAK